MKALASLPLLLPLLMGEEEEGKWSYLTNASWGMFRIPAADALTQDSCATA